MGSDREEEAAVRSGESSALSEAVEQCFEPPNEHPISPGDESGAGSFAGTAGGAESSIDLADPSAPVGLADALLQEETIPTPAAYAVASSLAEEESQIETIPTAIAYSSMAATAVAPPCVSHAANVESITQSDQESSWTTGLPVGVDLSTPAPKRAFRLTGPSTEVVKFGVAIGDDYFVESGKFPRAEIDGEDLEISASRLNLGNLKPGIVWDRRFRIIQRLGSGGMATVYKANQIQMSVMVALKVMHIDMLARGGTARFMREARLLSAVNHPNVVRLQAYGSTKDNVHFMALEFINGRPLSQILAEEKIDPRHAVQIAIQICRGLQAAHEAGIVHRDLKPSNILIARDDEDREIVKIIDFGIARLAEDSEDTSGRVTRTAAVLGTPYYMSPEQCMGQKADFRSDIYSLGCLLYEMLCGEPPFVSEQPYMVLTAHTQEPVRTIPSTVPIPQTLQDIIFQCMAKKPQDRYDSATELAEDLLEINWDTVRIATAKPIEFSRIEKFNPVYILFILFCMLCAPSFYYFRYSNDKFNEFIVGHQSSLIPLQLESRTSVLSRMPDAAQRAEFYQKWLDKKATGAKGDAFYYLAEDLRDAKGMNEKCVRNYDLALEAYKHQLNIEERSGSPNKENIVNNCVNASLCMARLKNSKAGEQYLVELMERFKSILPANRIADLYGALSSLALQEPNLERAKGYCERAVDILQKENLGEPLSLAKIRLVELYSALGHRDMAMVMLAKADQERCKLKDTDLADWHFMVAKSYMLMHAYEEVLASLDADKSEGLKREPQSLRLKALRCLGRWNEVQEATDLLARKFDSLPEAERWQAISAIAESKATGRVNVDLDQVCDKGLNLSKGNKLDEWTMRTLLSAARSVLTTGSRDAAIKILNRAHAAFLQSHRDTGSASEAQDFLAGELMELLICVGQFSAADDFALKVYDPNGELVYGEGLRIRSLHALADSFQYRDGDNKDPETKQEIISRIKKVNVYLTDSYPGSLEHIQSSLDRAEVQQNLRVRDKIDQWLNWAEEKIEKNSYVWDTGTHYFCDRMFRALCNKDPLFADKLYETGVRCFRQTDKLSSFKARAGREFFYAGHYQRGGARDLMYHRAIDIYKPIIDAPRDKSLPDQTYREVYYNLIYACEQVNDPALPELRKKDPALMQ